MKLIAFHPKGVGAMVKLQGVVIKRERQKDGFPAAFLRDSES
jgi:hypothetical protein